MQCCVVIFFCGRLVTLKICCYTFISFHLEDGVIRVDEFIIDWNSRNLGESSRTVKFFYNLDTNGDGVITMDPDLPRIFHFFDRDCECIDYFEVMYFA